MYTPLNGKIAEEKMMVPCLICSKLINTRTETYYTKTSDSLEQIYLHPACYKEYIGVED